MKEPTDDQHAQLYDGATCETCAHQRADRCHRFPPEPGPAGLVATYPVVRPGWTCGEHPVVQVRLLVLLENMAAAPKPKPKAKAKRSPRKQPEAK